MNSADTLIVVQSRFGSSRLPGKALYPLAGLPMVTFLLRRLKGNLAGTSYQLVLATSDSCRDDVVARWGEAEGVAVVRGSEDDVLARYLQCLDRFQCASVVRVTADNPLTCPRVLEQMVEKHRQQEIDYLWSQDLPVGAGVDIFKAETMRILGQQAKGAEREHINLHILENPEKFSVGLMEFSGTLVRPELSMTVDTREDWLRVGALFTAHETEPWNISLEQAIARMDNTSVSAAAT